MQLQVGSCQPGRAAGILAAGRPPFLLDKRQLSNEGPTFLVSGLQTFWEDHVAGKQEGVFLFANQLRKNNKAKLLARPFWWQTWCFLLPIYSGSKTVPEGAAESGVVRSEKFGGLSPEGSRGGAVGDVP